MPANAAIYLPVDAPDLSKVFLDAKSNAGIFKRRASRFTAPLNGSIVTFNVIPAQDLPSHLDSLRGYIASLDEEEPLSATLAFGWAALLGVQVAEHFRRGSSDTTGLLIVVALMASLLLFGCYLVSSSRTKSFLGD